MEPEDPLKLERLTAHLSVDHQFVRELLSEMALQIAKEYLTIGELAKRLSWEEKTVKNKMEAGIFRERRALLLAQRVKPRFKWSAIVAWLEEADTWQTKSTATETTSPAESVIP